MASPQIRISGISTTRNIVIAWVQNLCNGFFYPKSFAHATVSLRMLRAFSGVLAFRTQSSNEQAQVESGWELPVDF